MSALIVEQKLMPKYINCFINGYPVHHTKIHPNCMHTMEIESFYKVVFQPAHTSLIMSISYRTTGWKRKVILTLGDYQADHISRILEYDTDTQCITSDRGLRINL
jgi:hypothetical protein